MILEEKHYYDPLTSLKLFTEGEEFDTSIWWKIEYHCDNNGNIISEKKRELFKGKPPLYVPRQITYMPAVRRSIATEEMKLAMKHAV
ncbi:hypothetical protein [Chondrinema litorale]|uniref:hypothetical protein n=1 Tax=Chondrinema litorale TaxID=2994555 RepID=UPI002543D832|nr:hypothetical protein [Chondrinema litorale]UZR92808.1 hypothetical protein OQ292_13185 [Chondrinema litorale]